MSVVRFHFSLLGIISCWVFAAVSVAAAVSACAASPLAIPEAAAQNETAVQLTTTPCRFPVPDQQPVQCADLFVTEDHSDPDSRQIRLHVATIKSRSDTPAPDPLIILLGGPGAHTLDRLGDTAERFAQVLAVRDIILLDPRGIGYSQPSLNCPELDEFNITVIDEQLNREQEFSRRLDVYGTCRDRLLAEGTSLQAYSADAIAADIAKLRRALGYNEWNLYGVSYGARLALLIMRDYPEGLRTVVLDSVYPVELDLAAETAVLHTHALATLFDGTRADHPDFEQDFYALVDELDASPIAVPVADPRGQDWFYMRSFDGVDLLQLTIKLAHWPQSFPHMPDLVDDIARGDYRDLSHFLQPSLGDQLFSEGMNLSVNCQEIDLAARLPKNDAIMPILPRIYDFAAEDVQQKTALCKLWLGEDWRMTHQLPVLSETPALILTGEQDVLIAKQWDEQATAGLPNRVMVSFPDMGHGVMASDTCAQELVAAFLTNPEKHLLPIVSASRTAASNDAPQSCLALQNVVANRADNIRQ